MAAFPKTDVYLTGASRGLGKALAERLLQEASILQLSGIGRSHTIEHARYRALSCDLSDSRQLLAANLFRPFEGVEQAILINNAATVGPVGFAGDVADEEILAAVTLNVAAPAILSNRFLKAYSSLNIPLLICNVSSGAANYPVQGWGIYCASKAALNAYSAVLDAENHANLRVFSVAPGVVDTDMQQQIRRSDSSHFPRVAEFRQMKESGKLASPEAVAEKFWKLLAHPQDFAEVLQDVRQL